jgi:hypothetical protein
LILPYPRAGIMKTYIWFSFITVVWFWHNLSSQARKSVVWFYYISGLWSRNCRIDSALWWTFH